MSPPTHVVTKTKPSVVVVGEFQRAGKSTLVNCLLDDPYTRTGDGIRTTPCLARFRYGDAEEAFHHHENRPPEALDCRERLFNEEIKVEPNDWFEVSCWKPILKEIDIWDTPGFNANSMDDECAEQGIEMADFIVMLHSDTILGQNALRILDSLSKKDKRFLFLYNCREVACWSPQDQQNLDICTNIDAQLRGAGLDSLAVPVQGKLVWPCNLLWAWYALGHLQREAESPGKRGEKAQTDIKIIKKYPDCKNLEKSALLVESQFLPIRQCLSDYQWTSFDFFSQTSKNLLDEITSQFSKKVLLALKSVESNEACNG